MVALVTGSSKGIGKELIKELSKDYDVIINYNKSEKEAWGLHNSIPNSYLIKADVTKEEEVKNMINLIIEKYNRLDLIINNAALALDNYIEDKTKEEFLKVLETNVIGPFLITKYGSKYTKKIINISSTDAEDTYNEISIDYCASKAALNNLTKTTALAYKNINIYGIMLPWVNTESIKEANPEYIKQELERTKQKQLLEPNLVAKNIVKSLNKNIKSGSILRWSDIDD